MTIDWGVRFCGTRRMARLARVVIPGLPHHITQWENRRQPTFFCDDDIEDSVVCMIFAIAPYVTAKLGIGFDRGLSCCAAGSNGKSVGDRLFEGESAKVGR
jgi:hypothetical protein